MATDRWPDEEGEIVPGLVIGFCYCDAAVAEGAAVKVGTGTTATRVAVTTAAGVGDGIGVALKKGAATETIPVAFSGVVKMLVAEAATITIGDFVMNSAEAGIKKTSGQWNSTKLKLFGGSSYVLGMALQTSAGAANDEILVLLGKCI